MRIIAECKDRDFRITYVATNGPSAVFYQQVHRHAVDNVGHQVIVLVGERQS